MTRILVAGAFFATAASLALSPATGAVADVTANPDPVNFGTVTVGNSSTQTVAITNNTQGPLALGMTTTKAEFTTSQSSTTPCASSLAGGASCNVDVTYAPTSTGGDSGALQISYKSIYCSQRTNCWHTIGVKLHGHGG